MDPKTDTIYVTNDFSDTVSAIDSDTRKVTATIGVGDNPVGVAVDPVTGTSYVTNFGSDKVSVIRAP